MEYFNNSPAELYFNNGGLIVNSQGLPRETREELKIKLKQLDVIKKMIMENSKNDENLHFLLKRFLKAP